ncbi:MAG: hypothetical protein AAGD25_35955 [Cyanobacteria bacterium P01_F01_bin.150]
MMKSKLSEALLTNSTTGQYCLVSNGLYPQGIFDCALQPWSVGKMDVLLGGSGAITEIILGDSDAVI